MRREHSLPTPVATAATPDAARPTPDEMERADRTRQAELAAKGAAILLKGAKRSHSDSDMDQRASGKLLVPIVRPSGDVPTNALGSPPRD